MSAAALTFTAGDWNTAQTVTVTGVNDDAGRRGHRLHRRDGGGDERRRELQRAERHRCAASRTPTTTRRASR